MLMGKIDFAVSGKHELLEKILEVVSAIKEAHPDANIHVEVEV